MKKLGSSWNENRMAAAFCNGHSKKSVAIPVSKLYAQYRENSDMVTVFTRRGRKMFSRQFGDIIFSACVRGDELQVETMNGGIFVCNARTGELLETTAPAKTASAEQLVEGRQEPSADASVTHAA